VVLDVVLGILGFALGVATFQTGGTVPASIFGLILAGTGVVLVLGALIDGLAGRTRRR